MRRPALLAFVVASLVLAPLTAHASPPALATPTPPPSAEREGRIVGGEPTVITSAPWQVALLNPAGSNPYDAQFCGGSIISAGWILTAAHCVVDNSGNAKPPGNLQVLAGESNLAKTAGPPDARLGVAQVMVHPSYDSTTLANDAALLRLSTPLALDGITRAAVALPLAKDRTWPAAGTPALITGWGNMVSAGSDYPAQLRKATVNVLAGPEDRSCGWYPDSEFDPAVMLCAGVADNSKDACQGDSGGPLAIDDGAGWHLAGITSFGNDCAQAHYPGVYTRVTAIDNWVASSVSQVVPVTVTATATSPTTAILAMPAAGTALSGSTGGWTFLADAGPGTLGAAAFDGTTVTIPVSGLDPGSTYTWQVAAVQVADIAGLSYAGTSNPVTMPRPAPLIHQAPRRPLALPRKLHRRGWTRLVRTTVATNAGQQAFISVRCGRKGHAMSDRSSTKMCRITKRKGHFRVWLSGVGRSWVKVELRASAVPGYTAYRQVRRYTTRGA